LYAESSFKRRLTFPDGQKQEVDVKAGSVVWIKGHIHVGENIGDTNDLPPIVVPSFKLELGSSQARDPGGA